MSRTLGSDHTTYYCGQWIGKYELPHSDGYCGPSNGPQCRGCQQYQRALAVAVTLTTTTTTLTTPTVPTTTLIQHTLGSNMRTYYCSRYIGPRLRGSDGYCGPNNGPQCEECQQYQRTIEIPFFIGSNGQSYYCGRYIGRQALPRSDGYCGPHNGPQCSDCIRHQAQQAVSVNATVLAAASAAAARTAAATLQPTPTHISPSSSSSSSTTITPSIGISSATITTSSSSSSSSTSSTTASLSPTSPGTKSSSSSSSSSSNECKICLDREIDCVFIPCGHLSCCLTCGTSVNTCPFCRAVIQTAMKIYKA